MDQELLYRIINAAHYLSELHPRRYCFRRAHYLESTFIHVQLWDEKEQTALTPVLVWSSPRGKYIEFAEAL